MAATELETRVAALEAEVKGLKRELEAGRNRHWVDAVYASFANDPDFAAAMRLGLDYRESQRPERRTRRAKSTHPKFKR